jgi:translation initiation factor IF-3
VRSPIKRIARELLDRVATQMSDVAVVEQRPLMEGNTMLMLLAPMSKAS